MAPPLVAIHQPNFFPWLGYFDKIRRADAFVFLDAVDYPKNSWVNRTRLNIQGEARWCTCPVKRHAKRIADVEIDDGRHWRGKLIRTLEANYARAPRFAPTMALIAPLVAAPQTRLADFNITAIEAISAALGLRTRFERQTRLPHAGVSNALLASLVRAVGGARYLVGGGAGYHDDEAFRAAGVDVVRQNFAPASYGPAERFIPGLSVIDYLMYDGRPLNGGAEGRSDGP